MSPPVWLTRLLPLALLVSAAPADDLATTRWQIASHLYLLNWGRFDEADWDARIDYAANLGFNALRINVWWHEIVPDRASAERGGNWAALDHCVDRAAAKGLRVILTVCLRRPADGLFFGAEDRVLNLDGQPDTCWDGTTRCSFASPRFVEALRFLRAVGQHYTRQQNAGQILAIAPLVTREAEIAYAHDTLEDYHPAFVAEFRAWLAGRYEGSIDKLNAAWGTRHPRFDQVPAPRDFAGTAGRDWYRFRDLKTRQFVDSAAAALAGLPNLTQPYRLVLDYGNVGDPMAQRRGSVSFTFHADNPVVWGIKQNDAHDYDQRYTGSLLVANARRLGKLAFNEYFYDRDPARYPGRNVVEDSVGEITRHFQQGSNGVSYVGVSPGNGDLEQIIARLKAAGTWSAPVTVRTVDQATTARVRLSELLGLGGWQIKERYFDAFFAQGRSQVDLLIDNDFDDPLLPALQL